MELNSYYNTFMQKKSEVASLAIRFKIYNDGGRVELLQTSKYSFLFVLQGEAIFSFKMHNKVRLNRDEVIMVNKEQINDLHCDKDTILLEYETSGRIATLMKGIFEAFNIPSSETIALNLKMQNWCKKLFTDLNSKECKDENYYYEQHRIFTELLLEYPRAVLGALYIPLYACALKYKESSVTKN